MRFFEDSFRTIGTRGIVFTEEEMQRLRIKRIYNSVSAIDYADANDTIELLSEAVARGEYCLVEATGDTKLFKTSLILFEDIWSRNVFAIRNWKYYQGFPDLVTLYN